MSERDDTPKGPREEVGAAPGPAAPGPDALGRRDAARIARDERNMHAVLSAMAGRLSDGLSAVPPESALPARRPFAWRRWTVGPLAAAAAAAALLLLPRGVVEDGGAPPASPPPSMVSELDVAADRPFAVFPTNDPNIAVVWLLNPEESD